MPEPYTIHIYVVDGDPDGVKIVDRQNWTGWGIAFPRSSWPTVCKRKESGTPGVYILIGPGEGSSDELPTVYVGQGDEIRTRIDSHLVARTSGTGATPSSPKGRRSTVHTPLGLNTPSSTWRTRQDSATSTTSRILRSRTSRSGSGLTHSASLEISDPPAPWCARVREARSSGDRGGHWVRARSGARGPARHRRRACAGRRLPRGIPRRELLVRNPHQRRHAAAHQVRRRVSHRADSAITHCAPVERIEPYGTAGSTDSCSQSRRRDRAIPYRAGFTGTMQGPHYTSLERLLDATSLAELFELQTRAQSPRGVNVEPVA